MWKILFSIYKCLILIIPMNFSAVEMRMSLYIETTNVSNQFSQIKVIPLRVPLWIGYCNFCMEGHLKSHLKSFKNEVSSKKIHKGCFTFKQFFFDSFSWSDLGFLYPSLFSPILQYLAFVRVWCWSKFSF